MKWIESTNAIGIVTRKGRGGGTQTMAGREQKAKEGKWNGGFAPYGYRLDNGQLMIAEDEASEFSVCRTTAYGFSVHGK